MTILELKLASEMKKRGVGKLQISGILNLLNKRKKQKILMEYLLNNEFNNKKLIYKTVEIARS